MPSSYTVFFPVVFVVNLLALPGWSFGQSFASELARMPPNQAVTMEADSIVRVSRSRGHSDQYYSIQTHRIVDEPDQIIDLPSVEATPYAWKYEYHQRLLVGGGLGYPLVFGDWNQNGLLDVIGDYKPPQNTEMAEVAILEMTPDSLFHLQHVYGDSLIIPLASTDMDHDGIPELNIRRMQHFWNMEPTAAGLYPDSTQFIHRMWNHSWAIGSETFTDLDGDPYLDLAYVGDDTSLGNDGRWIFVAEYDSTGQSMVRRLADQPEEWRVSGIGSGDFDQDGVPEFVIGSIHGDVYVYESVRPNQYARVFDGTVPTANAYMNSGTRDIDNNGQPEFFIGGSAYYNGQAGTLLTWFEATGDNQYQAVRNVLLLGSSVLGTTELYVADLDGDTREELICAFGWGVVILQWNTALNQFDIFYLYRLNEGWATITAVTPYTFRQPDGPDLLISVKNLESTPRIKSYWFRSQVQVGVTDEPPTMPAQFTVAPPYPNPFNAQTTIELTLPTQSSVTVRIYDLTGHLVRTLIREQSYPPGTYHVQWDGTNQAGHSVGSGVYFCRVTTPTAQQVQKLVMVK